jgi:rhamnose utilization protein RhaD (predicted bifunctional aldolase and dehydrogenase)
MNRNNLISLSKSIGNNLDLTQGAGGNTSVKDGEIMWVKASGYCLQDAGVKNIFVPVNYPGILRRLEKGQDNPVEPEVIQENHGETLRPSIETTLHALMPHRYVIHVHSVNVLAKAVVREGEEVFHKLLNGIKWSWIPYARPGVPLTKEVQRATRLDPDVLVLANHGLVLGGNTAEEAKNLLNDIERRLNCFRRETPAISMQEINSLTEGTEYKPSKYDLVHSLAFDQVALEIVGKGSLYPDHVVFLGPGPIPTMKTYEAQDYLSLSFVNTSQYHQAIIVVGNGVIIHKSLSEGAEVMLHCLANTLLRIQPQYDLRYLTKEEEAELMGWDAEKYRKKIQQ